MIFLQRPPSDLRKLFDNLQKVSVVALHEVGELPHDEALAFYRHVPDHLRVCFPEGGGLDLVKLMADLLIEKISTFIAEQDFSFLSNTYIPGLPADITEDLLPQLIKHLCEQKTATSYYIAALVLADIIPTEIDMKRCDTDAAAYGQQRLNDAISLLGKATTTAPSGYLEKAIGATLLLLRENTLSENTVVGHRLAKLNLTPYVSALHPGLSRSASELAEKMMLPPIATALYTNWKPPAAMGDDHSQDDTDVPDDTDSQPVRAIVSHVCAGAGEGCGLCR